MGRIKVKRPGSLPTALQAVVDSIACAANDQTLSEALAAFEAPSHFERPDERSLMNWIDVLNVIDDLLARHVAGSRVQLPLLAPCNGCSATMSGAELPQSPKSTADMPRPPSPQIHTRVIDDDVQAHDVDVSMSCPSRELVMSALRISLRLVRNASHDTKQVYNSVDMMINLLADPHAPIVVLALEILHALHQRSQRVRTSRNVLNVDLISRLYALSHGFGGRENGLGLIECCAESRLGHSARLPESGASIRIDFRRDDVSSLWSGSLAGRASSFRESPPVGGAETLGPDGLPISAGEENQALASEHGAAGTSVNSAFDTDNSSIHGQATSKKSEDIQTCSKIDVSDVRSLPSDEKLLVGDFAKSKGVPKEMLFPLLAAHRRALAFVEGREARIEVARIRLLAIATLAQLQPLPPAFSMVFTNDAELVADMVAMAKADISDGLGSIPLTVRIAALRCLTATSSDRHRLSQLINSAGLSSHHGVLPSLLRAQVVRLLGSHQESNRRDKGTISNDTKRLEMDTEVTEGASQLCPLNSLEKAGRCSGHDIVNNPDGEASQSVQFSEAVIGLVHAVAMSTASQGSTSLVSSGALGTIVPLLGDRNPKHTRAVSQAIRAMECIIESTHASSGSSAFRDHGGVALVVDRIVSEVGIDACSPLEDVLVHEEEDEIVERNALESRGESRGFYELMGRRQLTVIEALDNPAPSSSTASRGILSHSKWALLRGLMRLLLLVLGGSGSRSREVIAGSLPLALRQMISRPFHYGGSLFAIAASMTADIAHAEPTATSELVKAGICKALLRSVRLGLPPSGEAIRCVPNILAALCLAPAAREEIVSASPLHPFITRLASPFYGRAMHGETPVHIGNSLDELMRHVEALRTDGSKALIDFLKAAAAFVKTDNPPSLLSQFDKDLQLIVGGTSEALRAGNSEGPERIARSGHSTDAREKLYLLDKMRLTVANNAARLAGFAQGSSEHQSAMVRMGGLQHLLDLRLAPANVSHIPSNSVVGPTSQSRVSPAPSNTIISLVNSFRSFFARHGPAVLKCIFETVKEDASIVLSVGAQLEGAWLEEEESCNVGKCLQSEAPTQKTSEEIANSHSAVIDNEPGVAIGGLNPKSTAARRKVLRKELTSCIRRLRVAIVILTGLSRSGPGSSAGTWEAASGSQVASLIAAVERGARYHLAVVYTGLTLQTTQEGDLCSAVVSASADPALRPVPGDLIDDLTRHYVYGVGLSSSQISSIGEAAKRRKVPPGPRESVRQEVSADAWALVTYAVAAQRLYSTLSRGLTVGTRRFSRDHSGYGWSTKALAATLGRIFALHLKAAEPLWDRMVVSSGDNKIVAAWDYIRGVLIEIRGCIFDESRRVTQSLILRSFLSAGGGHALLSTCRPSSLFSAATETCPTASDVTADALLDARTRGLIGLFSEQEMFGAQSSLYGVVAAVVLAASDVCGRGREFISCEQQVHGNVLVSDVEDSSNLPLREVDTEMRGSSIYHGTELGHVGSGPLEQVCHGHSIFMSGADISISDRALEGAYRFIMDKNTQNSIHTAALDTWNTLSSLTQLMASCPGLSVEPLGAVQPPTHPLNEGWSSRDLHRSSQAVAIGIVTEVAANRPQIVFAGPGHDSILSDLVAVVQAIASSSEELDQDEVTHGAGVRRVSRSRVESRLRAHPAPVSAPDPIIVASLVEMGFSEDRATEAVRHTQPAGLEYAMEWLLAHQEDGDDSNGDDEDSDAPEGDGEDDVEDEEDDDANDVGDMDEVEAEEEHNEAHDLLRDEEQGVNDDLARASRDAGQGSRNELRETALLDDVAAIAAGIEPAPGDTDRNDSMRESSSGTQSDPVMIDAELVGPSETMEDSSANVNTTGHVRPFVQSASDPVDEDRTHSIDEMLLGLFPVENGQDRPDREVVGGIGELGSSERLSLEGSAAELLQVSLAAEVSDLRLALGRTTGVSVKMSNNVLREVVELLNSETNVLKSRTSVSLLRSVKPVGQAVFVESKKTLFDVLESFVRLAIQGGLGYKVELSSPPLAVELLTAMELDGYLTDDSRKMYAKLIADGVEAAIEDISRNFRVSTAEERLFPFLHTAAVWVHHGGFHTRAAFISCGIDGLANRILQHLFSRWQGLSPVPSFEEDTVRPIQKLSLREAALRETTEKSNASDDRERRSFATKSDYAVNLKHLTACLLLLDGFLRYSKVDRVRAAAKALTSNGRHVERLSEDMPNDPGASVELATDGIIHGIDGEPSSRVPRNSADETSNDDGERTMGLGSSLAVKCPIDTNVENMDDIAVAADAMQSATRESTRYSVGQVKEDLNMVLGLNRNYEAGSTVTSHCIHLESMLEICLILLRMWTSMEVGDALPALLQLMASLTSHPHIAEKFWKDGGVTLVLEMPQVESARVSSTDPRLIRAYVRTIIRHVVEDNDTLREGMETDIRAFLTAKNNLGRSVYSARTFLSEAAAIAQRDVPIFLTALANTAKLQTGNECIEPISEEGREMDLIGFASSHDRENVKAVVESLVSLLADIEDQKPFTGEFSRGTSGQRAAYQTVQVNEKVPKIVTNDRVVFALNMLSELVSLFPVCSAAFFESPAPSIHAGGSALDYVLRYLLPTCNVRETSLGYPQSRYPESISEASRELFRALCLCSANSQDRVVASLSCAVSSELLRAKPRASATKSFALCITQGLPARLLRALVQSSVADSLALCLESLDLNDQGMNEVVSSVLRALEVLGKAALSICPQNEKSSIDDDDASPEPSRDEFVAISRGHVGRRYARSVFESLQNAELTSFDPF